jgi:serine/threonine protein kinase
VIDFIHTAGVIHGDLTCANIFLDENLNAKLADFAGSSIDGSPLLVGVTASHESPGPLLSIQGDLFAFGCVLYEIMTEHVPYDGKADKEIRDLYRNGRFPDTDYLGVMGRVITKCWQGHYSDCKALVEDVKGVHFPIPSM